MELSASEIENNIRQINLIGRLDIQGANKIEGTFKTATNGKNQAILVEMSQVTFIASMGIRLLINRGKAISGEAGKMVLLNPTSMVREALLAAGIDILIPIYNNLEDARTDLEESVSS
ncbi:MAG: STAS domain-containing protein [Chloroflexota bacterium]